MTALTTDATNRLITALQARVKVKSAGNDRWRAQCPAHGGTDLNLAVARGDQGVLIKCWSHDCSEADIARSVGLELADLFDRDGRALYDYGNGYKIQRTRLAAEFGSSKTVRPVRAGITPDIRPLWQPDGSPRIAKSPIVMLCEGEKTADALHRLGAPSVATWAGGTNGVDKADYEPLRGRTVVIVPDNDEPGQKAARTLQTILAPIAATVRTWRVPAHLNDAADLWLEGGNLDDLTVIDEQEHDASRSEPAPRANSWEPVDVRTLVAGLVAGTARTATPTRLTRTDGAALLYDGKVNGIHGESGSGKSWTALYACAQQIHLGRHTLYVDLEDSPLDVLGRLIALGADPASIAERFHYVQPELPFLEGALAIIELIRDRDIALVVIDSTGEALALEGVQPNADEEVARWFLEVPKRLAKLGPAVLILDHLPKAGGGDLMPIGSHRKRASINGAQYLQEPMTPFSKEKAGASKLVCAKDRHGTYARGEKVAILHLTPTDGGSVRISLTGPDAAERTEEGKFRPTGYMERVSKALELAKEATSFNGICERVEGKRALLRQAVDALISDGYLATAPGPRNSTLHRLIRPFRETTDAREPVASRNEPNSTDDRFRFLDREPGTSHLTESRNQSGLSGTQSGTAAP